MADFVATAEDESLSPDRPGLGAHPAQCPVVGVGASAGGLEAFQNFLSAAPVDAGLAYVLVQHLDPNHESMLAELLGRKTRMPVRQITDGMSIRANQVYLIPPNASLSIEKAQLKLTRFSEPRGFRRPIDDFFRSLAMDQGQNAACVVLSGTGGDGSEGLRAVKEAGGLTLAQDTETAKYDGMPKAAIATGLVDRVLPPADMPLEIRNYFDRRDAGGISLPEATDFLIAACQELRRTLGHDFSQYKRGTMLRRIRRRMQVVGAQTTDEYLNRLRTSPNESELLFRDLLINVTCFFRDPEAFDFLRRETIPELLRGKGAADTVRIWTPGCSSGEEAFSLAILFAEELSRMPHGRPSVQILATDIDEQMLQRARAGSFPHTAVKEVPPELLDRYFHAQEDAYVLNQSVRDMVRFSNHNLIKDPPFSRVDMVACRNLLIYFDANLQQRVIPVFHYALRPRGWLFLGSAENLAGRSDLFDVADNNNKIYRRSGTKRHSISMPTLVDPLAMLQGQDPAQSRAQPSELADIASRRVIERYAPAHVIVNASNHVVRSSTRTGRYLELAPGAPTTNVVELAKRELRSAVRSVLEAARKRGRRSIKRETEIDIEAQGTVLVDVIADPLSQDETLLVFQDVTAIKRETVGDEDADVFIDPHSDEERARLLEEELDETRSRLRTTVEELETSNEELKSSNEEMMSMNEELQSTNEELATVNEELKSKVDQLGRANTDMQNFIESTQIPTVFLDRDLRIRTFTPATTALFRFQTQDRGRLLADVSSRVDHGAIEALGREVLRTGEPAEKEFSLDGGKECYVLRVLPYRDLAGDVDGVVMVFTDVTKIRQTQADLARNETLARQRTSEIETLYKTAPVGMALFDRNQRFLKVNEQFAHLTGQSMQSLSGTELAKGSPELAERMARPIAEVFETVSEVSNFEASILVNGSSRRDFLIDFYPYQEAERVIAVGVVLKDVTELRHLERELRRLMDELQHRVKNTLATVSSIVGQTMNDQLGRTDLVDKLKSRIGALASTHTLLTLQDWRAASLREILNAELLPFDHVERISVDGPAIMVPPKHALCLTLTLHELATNAAKYGALSPEGGKLEISWNVSVDSGGQHLHLTWAESDVAGIDPSSAKPSFGSRLIRNAIVHDLQGSCEYNLTPSGLHCTLSCPF